MSTAATAYLAALVNSMFANGGHRAVFVPALNAVATAANEAAEDADAAAAAAANALASLTAALAIVRAVQGFGGDSNEAPRNWELGSLASLHVNAVRGIFPLLCDSAYQILPTDYGKLLYTTSGVRTWTMPSAAECPDGWYIRGKNRSGSNLTINRSGSDTFNAAATSLTIATGSTFWIALTSSTTFESF